MSLSRYGKEPEGMDQKGKKRMRMIKGHQGSREIKRQREIFCKWRGHNEDRNMENDKSL
jgi:hypothetical protein